MRSHETTRHENKCFQDGSHFHTTEREALRVSICNNLGIKKNVENKTSCTIRYDIIRYKSLTWTEKLSVVS